MSGSNETLRRGVLAYLREQFEDGDTFVDFDDLRERFEESDSEQLMAILKELESENKVVVDDDVLTVWATGGRFVWDD